MPITCRCGDPATARRHARRNCTSHIPLLFAFTVLFGHADAASARPNSQADWRSRCDAPLARIEPSPGAHGWTAVIARMLNPLTSPQERLLASLHADIYRHLPIIESVAMRVPTRNLARLAVLPFVAHLSLDGEVKKSDDTARASSHIDSRTRAFCGTRSHIIRAKRAIWGAALWTPSAHGSVSTSVADLSPATLDGK